MPQCLTIIRCPGRSYGYGQAGQGFWTWRTFWLYGPVMAGSPHRRHPLKTMPPGAFGVVDGRAACNHQMAMAVVRAGGIEFPEEPKSCVGSPVVSENSLAMRPGRLRPPQHVWHLCQSMPRHARRAQGEWRLVMLLGCICSRPTEIIRTVDAERMRPVSAWARSPVPQIPTR